MQNAISILGMISWIALIIGLMALLLSASCFFAEKLVSRIQCDTKEAVRSEIANDILNTAWWFSESVEAQEGMRAYGKALAKAQRCCSSTMREEWRKEIAKSKEAEQK